MPSAEAQRALGQLGEQAAADYLVGCGYRIVARNWRCAAGEIDLVASTPDCTVLVEVRTRRGRNATSWALASVGAAKQRQLRRVAAHYWANQAHEPADWRIDVIAVAVSGGQAVALEHLEAAVGA